MIRFHLDENIPTAIALGLRNRGRDVTTTHEVGLIGQSDEAQIQYARANSRVIVSRDQDLLRLAASGIEHVGIVYWTEKHSLGKLIKDLNNLFFDREESSMEGEIVFF